MTDTGELERLRAENERLRKRVHELEIDEMWNAYNSGVETADGDWGHAFMSDGEWLARELGFDPTAGWYPAKEVKAAINARAALEGKG